MQLLCLAIQVKKLGNLDMIEKISSHIENMLCEQAIRKQFEMTELELCNEDGDDSDPLLEKQHEVVTGLINKYKNRALCLLTAECAAYCRFCTRRRLVSDIENGRITTAHVDAWVNYLNDHPEVHEIIISGGDPFVVDDSLFIYALESLSNVSSIKVIRIGTRMPVSAPSLVNSNKLNAISKLKKTIYVGVHFEHPSELTPATIDSLNFIAATGAILYSQTVFLKDVNDDYQTLFDLFTGLFELGVRPYYIYRCDSVPGANHFIVDFEKERHIMTRLRSTLSGLACPTYVIDAPQGSGKIPVPLEYWKIENNSYSDFDGNEHEII